VDTRGRLPRLVYQILKAARGASAASRFFGVTVGKDCRILSKVVTTEPWLVEIGDRVTISTGVQFVTHDGTGWLYRDAQGRRYRFARICIGSEVFIGSRAVIMPGVSIGDRCVVAAGSVVTRSVPSGSVVAGVPARAVSTWDDLMDRVSHWASESEMRGHSYRERVDSVAEQGFVPAMDAEVGPARRRPH
jgi:acetyltransferase-like isoleucine patch superfamily enzyme